MKLYKEASLMMLPTSVKDGKLYSIFPQPKVIGEELVTYSDFNYGSGGWSLVDGKWTFDDTGSGYLNYTTISVTVGQIYKVVVDVSVPSGVANFRFTSGNGQTVLFDYTDFPDGVTTFYTTVSGVNGGIQRFYAPTSLSDAFTLNSISIREVDQLPADFDFSRGSNLAATRINEQGLIEKGRENLLLQSNNFDTSPWGGSSTIFTSGQSGYDGSNDAWLLTHPLSTNSTFQLNTNSGVQTFSIYAKSDGSTGIRLYAFGNENANAYFDLNNGAVRTASNVINSDIVSVGNGWYRCSITFNQTNTAFRIYTTNNATLQAAGSVYIQDAQLEVGLVATDYIESGATTGKAGVLEDLPRLDWNGSCPTLLLEPSRTNTFGNSEYFGSGLNSLVTLENNSTISPDGTQNASRIVSSQTAIGTKFWDFIGVQPGASENQVFSLFVKKYNHRYIQLIDNGDNDLYANFDIQDGVIGNYGSGATASIEDYGNGWYRCSIVCDGSQNINARNRIYLVDSLTQGYANATNVALGDGVYIWGAMQENNSSYATSYIPTHGTSVTRGVDVLDGAGDTNTFNDSEGVLFLDVENVNVSSAISISDDSSSNFIQIYLGYTSSSPIRYRASSEGTSQFDTSFSYSLDVSQPFKVAYRYSANNFSIWINGVKANEVLSGSTPIGLSVIEFYNIFGAGNKFDGKVKQILYFPTALSDNECINLTSI